MTLDQMIQALEDGPINYGPDDDRVLVPVATANEIARALRAGEVLRGSANEIEDILRDFDFTLVADNLWGAITGWDTTTRGDV